MSFFCPACGAISDAIVPQCPNCSFDYRAYVMVTASARIDSPGSMAAAAAAASGHSSKIVGDYVARLLED